MNETLKLRSQNHVHEHQRQQKYPNEFAESRVQLTRITRHRGSVRRGEIHLCGRRVQRFDPICQRVTGRHVSAERGCPFAIDVYEIVEPHQLTSRGRNGQAFDRLKVPVAFRQAQLHVVVFINR
jgi:hypothetical protein